MTRVKLGSALRQSAGGEREVEAAGATIGEVVQALVSQHPALGSQLFTEDGSLNRFVNVYLNGQDARYLSGLDTPVDERDEVHLLPAMAGG